MAFTKQDLDLIYYRTSGYCHLCHKKLARGNYAANGMRGAWEVEHSIPRCNGGTDHRNNLFAACIRCNRIKGICSARRARAGNGRTCAPLSREKRREAQEWNAFTCAITGGALGLRLAGPFGAFVGAVVGGCYGASGNPDK